MSGRGTKRIEIWESMVVVPCIWGTFGVFVFKVILGSFGALVSEWPLTRKGLAVEQNGLKVGTQSLLQHLYRVPFTLYCLRSFGGHSVHLSRSSL